MATSFGVFLREHILTQHHARFPDSFVYRGQYLEITLPQKLGAIASTLFSMCFAAGASSVLNRSRTTTLVVAGGTALVTFYAVTGYFKWCLTQPPADVQRRPLPGYGARPEPTSPFRPAPSPSARNTGVPLQSTPPLRKPGIASPGSTHTIEDFRQKPNWLIPDRTPGGGFAGAATNLRRESERAYFASLWKKIYDGGLASASHWTNFSDQDDMLRSNTLSVEEGAPWEAFARFAQKHIQ